MAEIINTKYGFGSIFITFLKVQYLSTELDN